MLGGVQDRYAGDVGDFLKFGLLRALCANCDAPLRLGVCWYLVPDEFHNADGRHISYLTSTNRHSPSLKACDPDLFQRLGTIVSEGRRNVGALESAGVLPTGTVTYSEHLRPAMTETERHRWHEAALHHLADADLVFADPDNGLQVTLPKRFAEKFTTAGEVADYTNRGQSLILYHHADRTRGGVTGQIQRRMAELHEATSIEPVGGVICRRGSARFFLVLATNAHKAGLTTALGRYAGRWFPHAEFSTFPQRGAHQSWP